MQIVIDIPDRIYKITQNRRLNLVDGEIVENAIKNGTPLPKGHGRLIDANSIYQIVRPIEETDNSWGITGETAIRLIHEAFNQAPTIIEAEIKAEGGKAE